MIIGPSTTWSTGATEMVSYTYRCATHGEFDLDLPMGGATATTSCPVCDSDAVRVFTAPMTRRGPAHIVAAIDAAEKSRFEPEVVDSPPPRPAHRRTPMAPPNPAFKKLPRP